MTIIRINNSNGDDGHFSGRSYIHSSLVARVDISTSASVVNGNVSGHFFNFNASYIVARPQI